MSQKVSIIIPCRNEEKYIEKCLDSILSSNYPKDLLSVYVCDGMSDDSTREIVNRMSEQHTCISLVDNTKKTTPFALNLGLKKSTADIKIILGAHATVDPDFILENIKTFAISPSIGCAGGIINNVYENDTSKLIGLAMSSSFGVGNAHFRTGNKAGYVDTVAFGAYKQEVFDKIGYFDEELVRNQDDEFNFRLLKNGFKIYLSPAIQSDYYVRGSFKKLFKQYYQYGYWKVFVNKKHKTVTTIRQLIPLFFVLFLIGGTLLSFVNTYLFYGFLAILLLYFAMATMAAIKKTNQLTKILQLVFVFFELHISYGLGYLVGIVDFLILGEKPSARAKTMSR